MRYLILFISLFSFAQQTKSVDFTSVLAKIEINPLDKSVSGKVTYNFVLNNPIDTVKIDAQNIDFFNLKINNIEVKYGNNKKQILLFEGYKSGKNILTFNYLAQPKQALYFIGKGEKLQIWTQGQGKYTSNWFPSFDDPNENTETNKSKYLIIYCSSNIFNNCVTVFQFLIVAVKLSFFSMYF